MATVLGVALGPHATVVEARDADTGELIRSGRVRHAEAGAPRATPPRGGARSPPRSSAPATGQVAACRSRGATRASSCSTAPAWSCARCRRGRAPGPRSPGCSRPSAPSAGRGGRARCPTPAPRSRGSRGCAAPTRPPSPASAPCCSPTTGSPTGSPAAPSPIGAAPPARGCGHRRRRAGSPEAIELLVGAGNVRGVGRAPPRGPRARRRPPTGSTPPCSSWSG